MHKYVCHRHDFIYRQYETTKVKMHLKKPAAKVHFKNNVQQKACLFLYFVLFGVVDLIGTIRFIFVCDIILKRKLLTKYFEIKCIK